MAQKPSATIIIAPTALAAPIPAFIPEVRPVFKEDGEFVTTGPPAIVELEGSDCALPGEITGILVVTKTVLVAPFEVMIDGAAPVAVDGVEDDVVFADVVLSAVEEVAAALAPAQAASKPG